MQVTPLFQSLCCPYLDSAFSRLLPGLLRTPLSSPDLTDPFPSPARFVQLLASNGYLHTVIPHGVYAGLSQGHAAAAAAEFLAAAVVCADDSFPAG
jgi:methylaspartate ammonia-lyase